MQPGYAFSQGNKAKKEQRGRRLEAKGEEVGQNWEKG